MLLILLLLLLSLQNSSVSIIWPWRLFGMCYQACKLSEASSGKLSVTRKWDVDTRWRDLCCFLASCFDSMPGLFFISGHSRNACNATSLWLHADRDFILQGDHRHVVLIIEGKKSPSPWEPRCSDDCSDILAGLLWPLDKNLCFRLLCPSWLEDWL